MTATAKDHRTAVMATLTAGGAHPYTLGQLANLTATALPPYYCEVYVTERVAEGGRFGGISNLRAWRVQIRAVAKSEDNAEVERTKAAAALEDKTVTVDGTDSTPLLRGATDDPIAPDDGWFSGLSEFTYYH